MKKVLVVLLAAVMVFAMASAVIAEEVPEGYTQVKVFEGTYGFGDAEITAYTNDDFSAYYLTWDAFDEGQVLEGTVEDGIVNVDYDETGFMTGDAQLIWDDAVASEAPWEVIDGATADEGTQAVDEGTQAVDEGIGTDLEASETASLDIMDYLWEVNDDMSDEEYYLYANRNYKFLFSITPILEEESFNAFYKAVVHLKQKKEGAREEYVSALENLTLTRSVADSIWFLWDDGKMPVVDGEEYTEEELDASTTDGYGFRPLVIKCLLEDPSTAKGNILVISGGANKTRGNDAEAFPAIPVFQDLGYNVFVLQYRISPYSGGNGNMDAQRAIRFIKYYGEKEGYGGLGLIAAAGWSTGAGKVNSLYNTLYGTLTPKDVYCSSYEPDEIDAVNSDLDAAFVLYGPAEEMNTDNPNWPMLYICAGSEDDGGYGDHVGAATGSRMMYDTVKDVVPAMLNIIEGAGHGFGVGQEGATNSVPACAEWPAQADAFVMENLN